MKVDIVPEDIALRILQRELNVVSLVADDQRTWNGVVEHEGLDFGTGRVDHPLAFVDDKLHLDNLRAACGDLLVLGNERGVDQFLPDAWQSTNVGLSGGGGRRRLSHG